MSQVGSKTCFVCKISTDTDEIKYGEWHQIRDNDVHYYCLLLSTRMERNGTDHDGILGFLEKDIRKCASECAAIDCRYCHKEGASIECKRKNCKKSFHLVCGAQNNCLFQFVEKFESFCDEHHGIEEDNVKRDCSNAAVAMTQVATIDDVPVDAVPVSSSSDPVAVVQKRKLADIAFNDCISINAQLRRSSIKQKLDAIAAADAADKKSRVELRERLNAAVAKEKIVDLTVDDDAVDTITDSRC